MSLLSALLIIIVSAVVIIMAVFGVLVTVEYSVDYYFKKLTEHDRAKAHKPEAP